MAVADRGSVLVLSAGSRACAVPLAHVVETMRPLPVEAIRGAPSFVRGLSVIRGSPTLVIDLRTLLDPSLTRGPAGRFVTLRVGARRVAVSVDAVLGVRSLEGAHLDELPPLLRQAGDETIEAIGTHDAELLVILRTARIVPDQLWKTVEAATG